MQNTDCSSIYNNPKANFNQLNSLVKDVRFNINALLTSQKPIIPDLLELPPNLLTSLENLDHLSTLLFKKTESKVNEDQQKYLIQCKHVLAVFYCYIQHFFTVFAETKSIEADIHQEARNLAFDFYRYASYELRTPFNNLKLYTQAKKYDAGTKEWGEFVEHIYSSPFVPENQDEVEKISYWVDILGEFIDDLPHLWQKFSDNDTA